MLGWVGWREECWEIELVDTVHLFVDDDICKGLLML